MSDLGFLGLVEAAAQIRAKTLSPVELTQALLDRIARLDPKYHAFIRQMPEQALAGGEVGRGGCHGGPVPLGPLHGVPYALKDIIDVAGVPTTCHSRVMQDYVAPTDAVVATRLKAAGGILLGKLATHEFAIGGPSFDLPWPPAVNPWGGKHFPGGSSSGSGAALAAGLVPAALGTDTGGSIRNPASMCGIVGLKPTYGRVSRRGVFPLSFSLDHIGPMTRTVADNALLLQVLAGHDPQDVGSADVAVPDFSVGLGRGIKGLKIGLVRHFYDGDDTAHPEMIAAIDAAADAMRALGAEVREIRIAPGQDYALCCRIILRSEAYAIHRQWLAERPEQYGELGRQRIMDGATVAAADYIDALRLRGRLTRATLDAMAGLDAILTASSLDPTYPIEDADAAARSYPRQARQPFNVTGQPALVVPAGFTKDNLPLSIQLVGHPFQETMLYRIASAYEQATRWVDRRPAGV